MACRSARGWGSRAEMAGEATIPSAPVKMEGSIISGWAMPLSRPNCAVAASALRPDMRRQAGSSTAVNARVPVMHSRGQYGRDA